MKTKIKKINIHQKRNIIIALLLVLIVASSSVYYVVAMGGNIFGWRVDQSTDETNTDNAEIDVTTPPTDSQIDDGKSIKDNTIKTDQDKTNSTGSIEFTANAIQNTSGLHISTIIQTTTNSGTCKLSLIKESNVVTKEVGVQPLSNYTTCKGFDIPLSSLSAGTWKMSIIFTSGDISSTTTSEIVIK